MYQPAIPKSKNIWIKIRKKVLYMDKEAFSTSTSYIRLIILMILWYSCSFQSCIHEFDILPCEASAYIAFNQFSKHLILS